MPAKQFAVIGLGRFGTSVARTLYELGYDVLGVDSEEEKTQDVVNMLTHVVQADATDDEALRSLGLRNFDVVVVAIGHDLQASILVTLLLKELGVDQVVVKAASELHGRVLQKIGADRVVFPERDMGVRLAHSLVATNILDYIELSPDYGMVEMSATEDLSGSSLRELDLRARFGVSVVAIRKASGEVLVAPGAEDMVDEGDVVVIIGMSKNIARLEKVREA